MIFVALIVSFIGILLGPLLMLLAGCGLFAAFLYLIDLIRYK